MANLELAQFEGAVYDEAKLSEYMEKYASLLEGIAEGERETYAKEFEEIMIAYVNNKEEYEDCEMMGELILKVYKAMHVHVDLEKFLETAKKAWAPKFYFAPLAKMQSIKNGPNMENHLIHMTARRIKMLIGRY